jgi:hypothetical protein
VSLDIGPTCLRCGAEQDPDDSGDLCSTCVWQESRPAAALVGRTLRSYAHPYPLPAPADDYASTDA